MRAFPFILVLCLGLAALPSPAAGYYETGMNDDARSGTEDTKPRLKRGTSWYRRPSRPTDVEQAALARYCRDNRNLRGAANAYQALVYKWPDSSIAAEAQRKLADIQMERGKHEEAFGEYQYLVDNYPGQFEFAQVLDKQFQIAVQVMTQRVASFLFLRGFQAPERALPMFEKIIRNAPSGALAAESQFNIGRIYEMNEEEEEAVAAYAVVQSRYFSSPWAEPAAFREARCLYRISEERRNDENALNAARAALSGFLLSYPASQDHGEARAFLDILNARLETLALEKVEYYDRIAQRKETSLRLYEDFLKSFPMSPMTNKVMRRIAELKGSKP